MKPDCNILNPLQRDGLSQDKRLIRALHPSHVLMDERDISDLLLYAKEYAKLIQFYSLENQPIGDWEKFITSDVTTLVAMIQKFDNQKYKDEFKVASDETSPDFNAQIKIIISLIRVTNDWFTRTNKELKLYQAIERVVNAVLNNSLVNVLSYGKRIETIDATVLALSELDISFSTIDVDSIQEDSSFFPSADLTNSDEEAIALRKVKKIFDPVYEGVISIVSQAPGFLEETLKAYHKHQPHIALFLAFLQLFKTAQDHLNTITKRHLDFYYQEVLQLGLRPEQPDEVHIVFKLAKNFHEELLEKDTPLKAGKDDLGANVFFALDNDIVLNKTKLYEDGLKTIFLEKDYQSISGSNFIDHNNEYTVLDIFAAPKANTLDGIEVELEDNDKWLTLGDATMPDGRVGFAISSPLFLLKEGARTITVVLHAQEDGLVIPNGNDTNNTIAHEMMHNILVQYSGEEAWQSCKTRSVQISEVGGNKLITFNLIITADQPPAVQFNKEVLSPAFNTIHPTLYFLFDEKGVAAEFLCIGRAPLTSEVGIDEKVPAFIRVQILEFLNAPALEADWADIAAIEHQDGPVFDDPTVGTAPGNEATGYDIGEDVARRLILSRNALSNSVFENLAQVVVVPGMGVDKMNDLIYSVCQNNKFANAEIKNRAANYDPAVEYQRFDMVIYKGKLFYAEARVRGNDPDVDASPWRLIPSSNPYRYFQKMNILKMDLKVSVEGMKDLILENDVGVINPAKPFLPFGPLPKAGSKFYIGSNEIFQKRIIGNGKNGFEINVEWADLPEVGFKDYYAKYLPNNLIPNGDEDYTAAFEVLKDQEWKGVTNLTFFEDNTTSPSPRSPLSHHTINALDRTIEYAEFENYDIGLKRGFVRLVLNKNFLHKNYPGSVTNYVKTGSGDPPREPYTPTFNAISVNYRSEETIDFSNKTFQNSVEQFFHIAPFGWQEFYPNEDDLPKKEAVFSQKLVPEFLVNEKIGDETITTDAEGTLYIGLQDLEPEQNVSILIQMAEGSADPDLPKQEVIWSYLSYNHWIDFEPTQILSDTTNDLLTSGIVILTFPKAINNDNTILAAGVFWIKASVARLTPAISQAIAVMPQAVKSSFRKTPFNDLQRLDTPLSPEVISKLKERRATVKTVLQPFSSFNGKLIEQNVTPAGVVGEEVFNRKYNEFYIRVSERLRHKNRAVTIDDYERLVLQQFSDVYKVKCINHTRILGTDETGNLIPASEHAPGHVKIIVVPDLRNRNAVNPLQPKVSSNRLDEIKAFLNPLKSDFVTLEVQNPLFEEVWVEFKVKFHQGYDKGFYLKRLQEDIVKFLSPWLYDEGGDLALGGKVHHSVILNFVEEAEYVDYVTDFKLNHFVEGLGSFYDIEEAVATSSSSAIVSKPAKFHLIDADNIELC